jgi:two-component system response regulator NreC
MAIRVLIVDDHGVLRAGLTAILNTEPDMVVVGEAIDGNTAISLAIEKQPDVILMDLSMPNMDGIEATRKIRRLNSKARILILSVHEDSELIKESIQSGAMGYILKKALMEELIIAIHEVMNNKIYLDASMAGFLWHNSPISVEDQSRMEFNLLTPREVDVLRYIAKGYTNKQTAQHLNISERTVEYHRGHITRKLNLHDRVDLIKYAEREDLI